MELPEASGLGNLTRLLPDSIAGASVSPVQKARGLAVSVDCV